VKKFIRFYKRLNNMKKVLEHKIKSSILKFQKWFQNLKTLTKNY